MDTDRKKSTALVLTNQVIISPAKSKLSLFSVQPTLPVSPGSIIETFSIKNTTRKVESR